MTKESRRISTSINQTEYEVLNLLFNELSDSSTVSSFVSEIVNLIKLELDGIKIFSKEEIEELLSVLREKDLVFQIVQPRHSFLYILKDYYKFDRKSAGNTKLLEKIDKMSNLQIIILARFIKTFASDSNSKRGLSQAFHFFLKEKDKDVQIVTQVVSNITDPEKLAQNLKENITEGNLKDPEDLIKFISNYSKNKNGGNS